MIRFEFCENPAFRHAAVEGKLPTPAIVLTGESAVQEAFALEAESTLEEQGMTGKSRRGRSKKFRGSSN